ncbi:hypothetical protein HZB89_01845 [archaeon]|nr:hypothetical protein [archaeon]
MADEETMKSVRKAMDEASKGKAALFPYSPKQVSYLDVLDGMIEGKKKGLKVIYVTGNRTSGFLLERLNEMNAEASDYFFIDCVSALGGSVKPAGSIAFIDNPANLTSISIIMKQKAGEEKNSLVVIDSLSTFLVYNSPPNLAKFLIGAMVNARESRNGILVLSTDKDLEIKEMESILQMADYLPKTGGRKA